MINRFHTFTPGDYTMKYIPEEPIMDYSLVAKYAEQLKQDSDKIFEQVDAVRPKDFIGDRNAAKTDPTHSSAYILQQYETLKQQAMDDMIKGDRTALDRLKSKLKVDTGPGGELTMRELNWKAEQEARAEIRKALLEQRYTDIQAAVALADLESAGPTRANDGTFSTFQYDPVMAHFDIYSQGKSELATIKPNSKGMQYDSKSGKYIYSQTGELVPESQVRSSAKTLISEGKYKIQVQNEAKYITLQPDRINNMLQAHNQYVQQLAPYMAEDAKVLGELKTNLSSGVIPATLTKEQKAALERYTGDDYALVTAAFASTDMKNSQDRYNVLASALQTAEERLNDETAYITEFTNSVNSGDFQSAAEAYLRKSYVDKLVTDIGYSKVNNSYQINPIFLENLRAANDRGNKKPELPIPFGTQSSGNFNMSDVIASQQNSLNRAYDNRRSSENSLIDALGNLNIRNYGSVTTTDWKNNPRLLIDYTGLKTLATSLGLKGEDIVNIRPFNNNNMYSWGEIQQVYNRAAAKGRNLHELTQGPNASAVKGLVDTLEDYAQNNNIILAHQYTQAERIKELGITTSQVAEINQRAKTIIKGSGHSNLYNSKTNWDSIDWITIAALYSNPATKEEGFRLAKSVLGSTNLSRQDEVLLNNYIETAVLSKFDNNQLAKLKLYGEDPNTRAPFLTADMANEKSGQAMQNITNYFMKNGSTVFTPIGGGRGDSKSAAAFFLEMAGGNYDATDFSVNPTFGAINGQSQVLVTFKGNSSNPKSESRLFMVGGPDGSSQSNYNQQFRNDILVPMLQNPGQYGNTLTYAKAHEVSTQNSSFTPIVLDALAPNRSQVVYIGNEPFKVHKTANNKLQLLDARGNPIPNIGRPILSTGNLATEFQNAYDLGAAIYDFQTEAYQAYIEKNTPKK